MGRFKKENKELLTYLLFEAVDEQGYIDSVKRLMDEGFDALPASNAYLTKKSLRKILRSTNKYIRYTGSKMAETQLLLYFCTRLKQGGLLPKKTSGISSMVRKTDALTQLYLQQCKKAAAALSELHEDLQYDYQKELDALEGGF